MAIYLTGDTHGSFRRIEKFCSKMETTKDDIIIILGDAGINFRGGWTDLQNKKYIIDAKYYAHNTQTQYDVHTLHTGNLYQIFTYVKNKDAEYGDTPHEVSGMLLYAKTDEQVQPAHMYHMSGNKISVRTLDINCAFSQIREQLEHILREHF